jgi:hypothetical protein
MIVLPNLHKRSCIEAADTEWNFLNLYLGLVGGHDICAALIPNVL